MSFNYRSYAHDLWKAHNGDTEKASKQFLSWLRADPSRFYAFQQKNAERDVELLFRHIERAERRQIEARAKEGRPTAEFTCGDLQSAIRSHWERWIISCQDGRRKSLLDCTAEELEYSSQCDMAHVATTLSRVMFKKAVAAEVRKKNGATVRDVMTESRLDTLLNSARKSQAKQ